MNQNIRLATCFYGMAYRKEESISQHGCLYDWGVAGYNKEAKQFYVNFGMGGLVYDEENVIAWKAFTDFENRGVVSEFLKVKTDRN